MTATEDLVAREYVAGEQVQLDRMGRTYWFTVIGSTPKYVTGLNAPGAAPVTAHKRDIVRVGRRNMRILALEIARRINQLGETPSQAVTAVGLEQGDGVFSENDEAFLLDDDDNTVIDLGWQDGERTIYTLHKEFVRWTQNPMVGIYKWEVRETHQLTTYGADWEAANPL